MSNDRQSKTHRQLRLNIHSDDDNDDDNYENNFQLTVLDKRSLPI